MAFDLNKGNAAYGNYWTDFKHLKSKGDALDTNHGKSFDMIMDAAKVITVRVEALRRSGGTGSTYQDFASDKEVKENLDGIGSLVRDLEDDKRTFQKAATECKSGFDALASDAGKEAKRKNLKVGGSHGSVDVAAVAHGGANDSAELAAAAGKMVVQCDRDFGWIFEWKPGDDRELANDGLERMLDKAKTTVADAALEELQHQLEPRRVNTLVGHAKKQFEKITFLLGGAAQSPAAAAASPIAAAADREEKLKEAMPLFADLSASKAQLQESVDTVTPKRANEMKKSDIKRDQMNYKAYEDALKALQIMTLFVEKSGKLIEAAGGRA